MAFEDALNRLADSVDKLTASVAARKTVAGQDTPAPAEAEAPPAPTEAPRPRGRPRAVPAPAAAPAPAPAAAIGYDDVRSGILELAEKQGHGTAMAVLGNFGVDHAKKLKPEQYGDVMAAIGNALKKGASLA